MMKRTRLARTVALILCASVGPVGAGIYQWTDADGKVHFGDAKPSSVPAREVEVQSLPRVEDRGAANARLEALQREAERMAKERAEKRELRRKEEGERAEREDTCRRLRARIRDLSRDDTYYYDYDDDGNRVYLAADEVGKRVDSLRRLERRNCGSR